MKIKRLIPIITVCAVLLFLSSCSGKAAAGKETSGAVSSSVGTDGSLIINTGGITTDVSYYNFDADGTTVQILALRDKDGAVHAAFNTCQSCSPSPKAYYLQRGDLLICQNCGFEFTAEDVGLVHGGCNPWPVEGIEITGETVVIPAASAQAMAPAFQNWAGPADLGE